MTLLSIASEGSLEVDVATIQKKMGGNSLLPGSSIRDLFWVFCSWPEIRGEVYVTSIWVINFGHEWKKLVVDDKLTLPIGSMYGIFANIYHQNQPNVGKYTIHGWYGWWNSGFPTYNNWWLVKFNRTSRWFDTGWSGWDLDVFFFSGQISSRPTPRVFTRNGGLVRIFSLFQGHLGWWNSIIWPEYLLPWAPQKPI